MHYAPFFHVCGLDLIGQESNDKYLSYHFDFRGSTVALTDDTGQVVERFQYSPYGLLMSGDASITPFLFNGMYGVMTDDNGLYYMRARFYSPEIRRFVNQDILLGGITDGQTLNRYAFVTGRPVSFIDPFGLEIRPLDGQEKEIIIRAINRIQEYGFLNEASGIKLLLERGNIKVDTELLASLDAFGEAGRFFQWINFAPELFHQDFEFTVVPTVGHEYAHLLDLQRCILPLDKTVYYGLYQTVITILSAVNIVKYRSVYEDYPNQVGDLLGELALQRTNRKNEKGRKKQYDR